MGPDGLCERSLTAEPDYAIAAAYAIAGLFAVALFGLLLACIHLEKQDHEVREFGNKMAACVASPGFRKILRP